MSGLMGAGLGGAASGAGEGMMSSMQPMMEGALQSMIGNSMEAASQAPAMAPMMAGNAGLRTAAMNPASMASAVPQIANPYDYGASTTALDTAMNEPPPLTTPQQAAQNTTAIDQLQKLGQASSAWAPTANVLSNVIKKSQQQRPAAVSPGISAGSAVPVRVSNPQNPATMQAMQSPLARYAMMLRGM